MNEVIIGNHEKISIADLSPGQIFTIPSTNKIYIKLNYEEYKQIKDCRFPEAVTLDTGRMAYFLPTDKVIPINTKVTLKKIQND